MLKGFGVRAETDGVDLTIYGGTVQSGSANSFNDHRIAMSTAVLACGVEGVSKVIDAQSVRKSYPNFFEDLQKVGGIVYDL